jgi:hypothetical protein
MSEVQNADSSLTTPEPTPQSYRSVGPGTFGDPLSQNDSLCLVTNFSDWKLVRGDELKLSEVVEVVTCHGFDNGLEGHGAALGMRDGLGG